MPSSEQRAKAAFTTDPAIDADRPPVRRRWHRWLGLEAIPDIHAVYGFFRDVTVYGRPLAVLSWPSTRFHVFWPHLIKKLVPPANHVLLLVQALRAPRDRVLLVREFDNLWFALLAPAFWWFRRRMVLNVNQNFARPLGHGARGAALRLLARLGFRMLWLDGAAALADVRPHFPRLELATPLFPVVPRATQPRPEGRLCRVGLVGYFRQDKGGVDKAVAIARELASIPEARVSVGFWNEGQRAQFAEAAGPGIDTCSTYSPSEYHAFLARCDALVVLAEADAYYYRHSGILMDCIAHRTLPICPAYPLLASIVTQPVPVGAVYGPDEDLAAAVKRVLAQRERLLSHFSAHAAARDPGQVGAALEALLGRAPRPRAHAAIATK